MPGLLMVRGDPVRKGLTRSDVVGHNLRSAELSNGLLHLNLTSQHCIDCSGGSPPKALRFNRRQVMNGSAH